MMKMKRKTRLAMAVGGAIAGVAASGLVLAQGDDMGQIVTFPYYTVNGGWQTLFNVTNTTSAALAVKVRFHEAQNSRDVLDFNILMSPYDAWTGWVEPLAATGGMVLKTTDNSCTSPVFDGAVGLPAKKAAYTGDFADGGPDTAARLTEGYVELIVMGKCSPNESCFSDDAYDDGTDKPGIGYLTEHVDGTPRDCTQADKYFEAGDNAWADTQGVPGTGNPIAAGDALSPPDPRGYNAIVLAGDFGLAFPLKGNETVLNLGNGVAGGNAALHFGQIIGCYPFARDADGNITGYQSCSGNLVTAQQFPWFLEPTTATAPSGLVWNASGLRDFELDNFNEQSLLNEWSSNPDLGVATDWIVTFSTKGFHVDQFCGQVQANNNRWRYDGLDALTCATPTPTNGLTVNDYSITTGPGTEASGLPLTSADPGARNPFYPPSLTPFKNRWANGMSNIALSYVLYDREEGTRQASGTAPSPAPPATLPQMPYETNVLAFTSVADPNRDGFALPEGSAVASPNPAQIDASAILGGAPNGWMDIVMPCYEDGTDGEVTSCSGLPVTGFMVKTRTFGTPDMHYGQIQNHGYRPGYNYGIGPGASSSP